MTAFHLQLKHFTSDTFCRIFTDSFAFNTEPIKSFLYSSISHPKNVNAGSVFSVFTEYDFYYMEFFYFHLIPNRNCIGHELKLFNSDIQNTLFKLVIRLDTNTSPLFTNWPTFQRFGHVGGWLIFISDITWTSNTLYNTTANLNITDKRKGNK